MAVDLQHTNWLTSDQFLPDKELDDILSHSQDDDNNHYHNINNKGSSSALTLKPPQAHSIDQVQMNNNNNKDQEDFIAEIAHQMDRLLLLDDDDQLHYSDSASNNMELSWEFMGSPQSTLWSPLGSNQGSSEGSSQEPSPPPTPANGHDQPCWKTTTYDMPMMFENINLNERSGNSNQKIQNFNSSTNIGRPGSYQSLIQEQIRSIELTRQKQEQVVLSQRQRGSTSAHGEKQLQGHISQDKEHVEQTQKKGLKGCGNGGRRTRPPRPSPLLQQLQNQQQGGSGMRAMFLGGSGSSGGTGVFLPRAGTNTSHESTKKQGKCEIK